MRNRDNLEQHTGLDNMTEINISVTERSFFNL